jgi:hypothetical protein
MYYIKCLSHCHTTVKFLEASMNSLNNAKKQNMIKRALKSSSSTIVSLQGHKINIRPTITQFHKSALQHKKSTDDESNTGIEVVDLRTKRSAALSKNDKEVFQQSSKFSIASIHTNIHIITL